MNSSVPSIPAPRVCPTSQGKPQYLYRILRHAPKCRQTLVVSGAARTPSHSRSRLSLIHISEPTRRS
eukprot:5863841-Prymnesium_polylepis.1